MNPLPHRSRPASRALKQAPFFFPRFLFPQASFAFAFAALAAAGLLSVTLSAQPGLSGSSIPAAVPDPAIAAALAQVSEARIRQTIEKLVSFGNRSTLSSMETDLPPGTGVSAAADWIYRQFEEISRQCGGCLEVKRDIFTNPIASRIARPTAIDNIYAILRGSDATAARRLYLVTGHYDSRNSRNEDDRGAAPGANDDASGVAVSLECARVLTRLKLPASLVFVAVAGEEQGLNGSAHLAKLAKDEGWQLEGVLNNDIVGGNTTPGDLLQRKDVVRVFSEGIPATATPDEIRRLRALGAAEDAPSRQLARAIADAAKTYFPGGGFAPFLVARPDRYLRGGDHSSFNAQGFAAVRLTEWREDFNHQHQDVRIENGIQYGDLLQFVDFGYVARVTKLNAATLATLAASPGIPVDLKLVADKLDNATTLTWKPPLGADAEPGLHYELLWRETTAPDWQYALTVPAARAALAARPVPAARAALATRPVTAANPSEPITETVPIAKDNVIFGVRAVDSAGHRGLAAIP